MATPVAKNSERGISKTVLIILIAVGAILLVLGGIVLLAPNATHARMMAAEYAAMAAVRSISAHQVMYYSSFENAGYARDLASLGPGPDGKCAAGSTADHACFIDAASAGSACTGTNLCGQGSYKFNVQGICANGKCADFVISATPVDALNGSRNFCATSDSVVRSETAAPKSAPFTLAACQALPAIQ
jgi:hypothetical protein